MPLPDHIYRVLRDDENIAEGLNARKPDANITPSSHIAGKRDSQYISTTATLETAKKFLDNAKEWTIKNNTVCTCRMVKINVEELKNVTIIIDLSDPDVLNEYIPTFQDNPNHNRMFRNWATAYKEVLVAGTIPSKSIKLIEDEPEVPISGLSTCMSKLSVKE